MKEFKNNLDVNRREQILFCQDFDKKNYWGGCRDFKCSPEIAKQLIEEGFLDPDSYQNSSPTAGDLLEYAEDYPGDIELTGYAISPDRSDYRTNLVGLNARIPDTDYDNLSRAIELLRDADEFTFSHHDNYYYLHTWWD